MVLFLQVLLLLSFANGMPSADDSALERVFSLSIAGAYLSLCVRCRTRIWNILVLASPACPEILCCEVRAQG